MEEEEAVLESRSGGDWGTPGRDLGTRARFGNPELLRPGQTWSTSLSGTRGLQNGIWEPRNVPEFRSSEDRGIVELGCGIPEL